jgi:PncC family amidohydrolase
VSDPTRDDLDRLAERVAGRLRAAGGTLALAESCTGGLVAAALTAVPGASDFLWGAAVVYSEDAKLVLAGIEAGVLEQHGPVSRTTSEALAAAMRRRAGATYGLAVTGWAGPTAGPGGTVGEAHGCLSHAGGAITRTWRICGDREAVRVGAAAATLALLQQHLDGAQDGDDE